MTARSRFSVTNATASIQAVGWFALLLSLTILSPGSAFAQRSSRIERLREQMEKEKDDQDKQQGDDRESRLPPRPNVGIQPLAGWLVHLEAIVPQQAAGFSTADVADFRKSADAVEGWAAEVVKFDDKSRPVEVFQATSALLDAKDRCDRLLNQALELRTGLAAIPEASRNDAILHFLAETSGLIDLSGRLRYLAFDSLSVAADEVADAPALREQLLDELIRRRSNIGAAVSVDLLYDPPADEAEKTPPASVSTKRKVLELIAATGQMDLLGHVARFARNPRTPPSLLLTAAETLRQIGLPQDIRPGQDPQVPPPAITAKELLGLLSAVPQWRPNERRRVAELTQWLSGRIKFGLAEDRLRLGRFDVYPGDWLLMRNPSPYNLFTNYSPGLFTHVGVVAMEKGADGIRRMVLVDLPERGSSMPATNVDAFVDRTLNYIVLRHPDPAAAAKMGAAAATLIGCPTEFDLNFQTDRVIAMKGLPLAGQKIHTYCAGLLLLCAQESGRPTDEFFPIPEGPAGGFTVENLKKIGITFGDHFVSPTGALFSPKLQIAGRREPMYDPQREVEEAIYDYFADGLKTKHLVPTPDLQQTLRLKMAEASKSNPLLAAAMAKAANVSQDLDLVSAAKAAAVVEALDDVATGNSGDFLLARRAIMEGAMPPPEATLSASDKAKFSEMRDRHAKLTELWDKEQLSPRGLRLELVKYYIDKGKGQIDGRFFSGDKTSGN